VLGFRNFSMSQIEVFVHGSCVLHSCLKMGCHLKSGIWKGSASYSKSQVEVLIFPLYAVSILLPIHPLQKRERHLKLGIFLGSLPLVFIPCLKLRSSFAIVHPSIHIPKTGCRVKLGLGGAQLFYSNVPKLRFSFLTGVLF
jgi:hypothetical protein